MNCQTSHLSSMIDQVEKACALSVPHPFTLTEFTNPQRNLLEGKKKTITRIGVRKLTCKDFTCMAPWEGFDLKRRKSEG